MKFPEIQEMLPIGREVTIIRNALGPCNPEKRTVKRLSRKEIVFDTPKGDSYLSLKNVIVERTLTGFVVMDERILCEYQVDDGQIS